jgi:flagellar motor switch protein FliG
VSVATQRAAGETLSGRQKVAIVFMAMGPRAAADIAKSMTAAEVEEISLEIAKLEAVPKETVTRVLTEWGRMETAALDIAQGGVECARELLEQSVGAQQAASIV